MRKIKLIIGIVIAATVLYFASNSYFSKNPVQQAADSFVRNSPQVTAKIGQINSLSLRRYVSVAASDNAGAYRLYDYMVRGDKGNANVVVRATQQGNPPAYSYTVESLDQ